MSYNPAINMPRNIDEWEQLIDFYLEKENGKAAADPKYQKQTRAQIEAMFACYYPRKELLMPI